MLIVTNNPTLTVKSVCHIADLRLVRIVTTFVHSATWLRCENERFPSRRSWVRIWPTTKIYNFCDSFSKGQFLATLGTGLSKKYIYSSQSRSNFPCFYFFEKTSFDPERSLFFGSMRLVFRKQLQNFFTILGLRFPAEKVLLEYFWTLWNS